MTQVVDQSTSKGTLILVGGLLPEVASLLDTLKPRMDILHANTMQEAVELAQLYPSSRLLEFHEPDTSITELLFWPKVFDHYPDGVAVINQEQQILWHNPKFAKYLNQSSVTGQNAKQSTLVDFVNVVDTVKMSGLVSHPQTSMSLVNKNIEEVLGVGQYQDGVKSPFLVAKSKSKQASAILKFTEKLYCELEVIPISSLVSEGSNNQIAMIVFLRDFTSIILQQQKLDAIFKAMTDFGEYTPEDLEQLSTEDRVDILRQSIMHHTEHTLEYNTIEIRLLDHKSMRLNPLLAMGMDPEAEQRELYARTDGNGVTGYVAATGKSYLCENIEEDPHYLPGAPGAKSSITIPLILHDQLMGTLNVESSEIGTFTNFDLKFLEMFGREVSMALNTLNLLVVQQANAASESCNLMLRQIASPVDEILNDTCWILDQYKGDDPKFVERLQNILEHTREIRLHIFNIEEQIVPESNSKFSQLRKAHPLLRGKRVLFADADQEVRRSTHEVLLRYGAQVETAHNGEECLALSRRTKYDLIFIDINLPDIIGYNLYVKLKKQNQNIPIVFVKGFGWDRHHSISDGKQFLGALLAIYKPILPDQLILACENAIKNPLQNSPPLPVDLQLVEKAT